MKKIKMSNVLSFIRTYLLQITCVLVIVVILILTHEKIIVNVGNVKDDYNDMVTVINKQITIEGKDTSGFFTEGKTVVLNPYKIGKYEVSYGFWTEVQKWAENEAEHKYMFTITNAQPGLYGGANSLPDDDYINPFLAKKAEEQPTFKYEPQVNRFQPATMMSWRDAVLWCNALSEKENKTPVYFLDGDVLRDARDSESFARLVAKIENNGYRLPSEAEWELAARGGDPNKIEWDFAYSGTDSNEELFDYAWFFENSGIVEVMDLVKEHDTNTIGMKKPNSIDLYDMSGNVWEWTFDSSAKRDVEKVVNPYIHTGFAPKIIKGGGFKNHPADCNVRSWGTSYQSARLYILGFRLASTITD